MELKFSTRSVSVKMYTNQARIETGRYRKTEIPRMTGEVNPQRLKQRNKFFYVTNNRIPFVIRTTYTNT